MENKFYIYLHIKLTDGSPFYVGKGSGKRLYDKARRSILWNNIVNKYGYDVILLEEELTEEDALKLEVYWINRIGRRDLCKGPLVNHTDGGEGGNGRIVSDEEKLDMSIRQRGDKNHNFGKEPWNKGKSFQSSQNSIKLINSKGEIFDSIKKAAIEYSMEYKTLFAQVKGYNKNKTDLTIII